MVNALVRNRNLGDASALGHRRLNDDEPVTVES